MGVVPYVFVKCPNCGEEMRVYAQGCGEFDFPELSYRQDKVPLKMAQAVAGKVEKCEDCGTEVTISAVIPFAPEFTNIWGCFKQ